MSNKLWFKAKRFGWGWTPVSWQGWLLTIMYVFFLVELALTVDQTAHSASDEIFSFAVPFVCITVLFLVVCYAKGEKPGWRWGGKK